MNIPEHVTEIIADQLDLEISEIRPSSLLTEELGANSLDKVEIIIVLETDFDIVIHDQDAQKIKTIQDIIDAVMERIKEKDSELSL